jgi:nitrate/nitrite transporter NarK
MRMLGVRILRVVVMPMVMPVIMTVIMRMAMLMIVTVTVVMMVMPMRVLHLEPAHTGTKRIAQIAISHVGSGRRRSLPLYVMVMALLHRAHFGLKTQDLRPVLAHHAGRRRRRIKG